jgi:hypothetical protein
LFLYWILSRADEETKSKIEDALAPPNRVDPTTGMPFGWSDDNELAGFDQLVGSS